MADKNCPDFKFQQDAQTFFTNNGGSATNNVDGLDHDHDGKACENLPSRPVTTSGWHHCNHVSRSPAISAADDRFLYCPHGN